MCTNCYDYLITVVLCLIKIQRNLLTQICGLVAAFNETFVKDTSFQLLTFIRFEFNIYLIKCMAIEACGVCCLFWL